MSTDCLFSSEEPFAAEMRRLLETASHSPWGPGREIDATVHDLHLKLQAVQSRLGSDAEQTDDRTLAHKIDHDLRNKLMIYHYHEQKRRLSAPPMPHRKRPRNRSSRRVFAS
ncbi:MAG TPA: hypothetical protein VGM64_03675 [Lacunisphaera sp.]|jgi:hypothetical protein